jgi:hypothetical protein
VSNNPVSVLIPLRSGPRKPGQSPAIETDATTAHAIADNNTLRRNLTSEKMPVIVCSKGSVKHKDDFRVALDVTKPNRSGNAANQTTRHDNSDEQRT